MKIGDSIREIREKEKNYTQNYVAKKLGITTRAYGNIENNVTDISLNRLEQIAQILECNLMYIINYKEAKGGYHNQFYNNNGNQGTNVMNQGDSSDKFHKVYEALFQSQNERIALLEKLLQAKGIDF